MKQFLITTLVLFPASVFAADTVELMTDLPFIGQQTDLAGLLQGLFKLTLAVAVSAAVVIIVINGIRYMTTDIVDSKADAKKWIFDVLKGLLLAFASVLILSTINPQLTSFDFLNTLHEVGQQAGEDGGGGGTVPPQPPGGGGGIPNEAEEMALRSELELHDITASRPCKEGEVTQDGCVTLYGLPQGAIQRLITLAEEDCKCALRVTGGVEPGHDTHGPGLPMADLNRGSAITALIQNQGELERVTCLGPLYNYNGSQFLDENKGGAHWHACLGTQCSFAPGC